MTSLVVAGSHPLMQKIRSLASRLATCDTPALILGEPGTGKEALARHIHQQSKRATRPVWTADCTSIASADDLWAEVRRVDGGTLHLSDIDSLEPDLHSTLSELLDGRGKRNGHAFDVRIIASAESELPPDSDLFEGLSRICLFLPPLRERRSDIPLLIRHLLDKHASELDGPLRRLPDETLVLLWQYDWPGNLRELSEVVRQCAGAAMDGIIRASLLPAPVRWSFKQGAAAERAVFDRTPAFHRLEKDETDSSVL